MSIIYASSSSIGVPLLNYLATTGELVAVLTAPDQPQGRGRSLQPNPVKARAVELGIPTGEFSSLGKASREWVASIAPDDDNRCLIAFSYGRIFGPKFCALYRYTLNVHPSSLPALRGPSPLAFALAEGIDASEICLQTIAARVDEGDILARLPLNLTGLTALEAHERAGARAVELLAPIVPGRLAEVYAARKVQVQEGASYTRMLTKADGRISWELPARVIAAHVRALMPWPGSFDMLGAERVILHKVQALDAMPEEAQPLMPAGLASCASTGEVAVGCVTGASCEPGQLYHIAGKKGRLFVCCAEGALEILKLQKGPKTMDAASFLRGRIVAAQFGSSELAESQWPLTATAPETSQEGS